MKSKNSGYGKRVLVWIPRERVIELIEMGRGLKGFYWVTAKTVESCP